MKKRIFIFVLPFCFLISFFNYTLNAQNITQPQPYGGNRLMKEFVREEMVYPEKALKESMEGTVVVSFNVNADGKTGDFKIATSASDELDKEAIRICRYILWYPATDLGRPVAYRHSLEIKFDIKKYENIVKSRGYDKINFPYTPIDTGNIVYKISDISVPPKPVFTSKDFNLSSFISNNLHYPETAFKQNISGLVRLKFVVEPSGRISNLLTEKTVGGGCTEEAIRVVKMIRWYPGIKNDVAVRSWMTLDITFDIAKKSVSGTIPAPGQVH
jgi:TonB family protein